MDKAIPPGKSAPLSNGVAGSGVKKCRCGLMHKSDAKGKLFGNDRTQSQEATARIMRYARPVAKTANLLKNRDAKLRGAKARISVSAEQTAMPARLPDTLHPKYSKGRKTKMKKGKKLNKRCLAIFMTLMMVMGSFQITVFADEELSAGEPAAAALEVEPQTENNDSQQIESETPTDKGESADKNGEPSESEPTDEEGEPSEGEPSSDGEAEEPWDLTTDTKRPEGTVEVKPGNKDEADFDVNTDQGESGTTEAPDENPENPGEAPETPSENPENPGEASETPSENPENPGVTPETPSETPENPWDVFYDEETDTYKLTFKIDKYAEGDQVMDLTLALELLGQYAGVGKNELQAAIDALAKPMEPGKPENLDTNLDTAYGDIVSSVPRNSEGEPTQNFDYAGVIAEKTGLSKDDPFVKETASYMYDQVMVDWVMDNWNTWKSEGHMYANYFGDPDTMLYYGCGISVKWPDGINNGTPVLKQPKPEYQVDESSNAYQEYKAAMKEYKDEVERLKAEYNSRIEADVLEPGDIRKFEISLASGSKHTYVYKNGSFTLATPDWTKFNGGLEPNKDGIEGFDGQILPDKYIDNHTYYLTLRCDPVQDLLKVAYPEIDEFDLFNGPPGYVDTYVKEYLGRYNKDSLEENMKAYLLDYYGQKTGKTYESIDQLVKENADAREQLTKTTTSGNKWFDVSGTKFIIDAHLETVIYDTFYKTLFSFVYGDKVDIDNVTGDKKIENSDGSWGYENDSWTYKSELKNALYYYMDHKEIWETTDKYFQDLLKDGLSADKATWTAFMMALNIDGELTGNDWQNTKWPWYNSIILERNDYDFNLVKKDAETGETIENSATKFYIWYMNSEGEKVYISYKGKDEDGEDQFEETKDKVALETTNGNLSVIYILMKDKIYYLQEAEAPEGYELDPTIYVLTDSIDKANAEIEDQKNEINDKIADLQDELNAIIAANPDYTATSEKFKELKEKVDKYLAEDKDSNAADAADYAKYLQDKFNELLSEMGITELENMLTSNASGVSDAVNVFNAKKDELSDLLVKANDRIAELNASLQNASDSFQKIKAQYEASENTAERAGLRAQLVEIQNNAKQIIADLAAVKAEYEASKLHAEYKAAYDAAQSRLDSYNGYLNTWMTRNNSADIIALKDKINTLKELKDAQEALNNNEVSGDIKELENQIKIAKESIDSFISIKDIENGTTDWMENLVLSVDFGNKKETQEKDFNVNLTEKSFVGFSMPAIFEGVLIEALNLTFDVPDPDPTPENPTPGTPDPTPSNPSSPGSPSNPPSEIPDPDVPLADIPEEEPPLTNIPEEEPPLANIPEEEPPLSNIPDEEPPLSEIPDEEVPLADIPDEDVPLDTVPQTGDDSYAVLWMALMLFALCAIAGIVVVPVVKRNKR